MGSPQGFFLTITLIVFLALLVQLPLFLNVTVIEYDEAIFLDVASNIQRAGLPLRSIGEKGVFYFEHPPLYPYFLSLYAPKGVILARLVTTLFGVICVLLAYSVGNLLGMRAAGIASALIVAVHSFLALYSHFIYMEMFIVLFVLVTLFFFTKLDVTKGNLSAIGLTLAMALLFKEVILLFSIICGAYILTKLRNCGGFKWIAPMLVAAPSILALLAWAIWCWKLSPAAFASTIQRWIGSAIGNSIDPRTSLTAFQWAHRVIFDLLGPGLTVLWISVIIYAVARKKLWEIDLILLGYPIAAILLSFLIRLKEPRHLIGIIPCIALFIGTKIDWDVLLKWARSSWLRAVFLALVAGAFIFSISPLTLPLQNMHDIRSWFDPLYAWRLFENDRYYNVLRLTGLYLREHTNPDEIITVVHEATVTAYYANRHYYMLYTLPLDRVMAILEQTRWLVWDHELFLALDEGGVQAVREYVKQHFSVEQVIRDQYREVIIYRREDF